MLESCRENVPDGATRPSISAWLEPKRGTSGHVIWLHVAVQHGTGETLLPEGFALTGGSDAFEVLENAHWFFPDPVGGTKTVIEGPTDEERAANQKVNSRAEIPFVPLPEDPGTHRMTLPPIPIAVARANGQVMTVCTKPLEVVIDDPIANEPNPEVHPNPPPRPQRERWESLVRSLKLLGIVLPIALGLAGIGFWWLRRPKPEPPKPKIPPWVIAMRELDEVRRSRWLEDEKLEEYFDRVDHITRFYLGERYGFDGLESTSQEIRDALSRVYPPIAEPERVHKFLEEGDFLKYAEVKPEKDDCIQAFDRAVAIVRATTPRTPKPERDGPTSRRAA